MTVSEDLAGLATLLLLELVGELAERLRADGLAVALAKDPRQRGHDGGEADRLGAPHGGHGGGLRADVLDDVVLATPEVVSVSVEDAEFAVVATDGVWAFVDDARAVDTVADALSKSDDVAAAAEALSTLARERAAASPRGVDDIAVVVLVFKC